MSYEYRCKNEKCISHSLRCGGNNPCGDNSDCLMTYGAMTAIGFGGICALASTVTVIFVIYKNRKTLRRRHRKQPHTFTPVYLNLLTFIQMSTVIVILEGGFVDFIVTNFV